MLSGPGLSHDTHAHACLPYNSRRPRTSHLLLHKSTHLMLHTSTYQGRLCPAASPVHKLGEPLTRRKRPRDAAISMVMAPSADLGTLGAKGTELGSAADGVAAKPAGPTPLGDMPGADLPPVTAPPGRSALSP